ncbi:hypothetical protein KR200_007210 [Drosophila serrata]|nr:hypothetical protein KR200_007210 [Drosophila serrata]
MPQLSSLPYQGRDTQYSPATRRGYVPVEQKIQRELQDLKSRETELKRLRKNNRHNTLKASLDKLQISRDDLANADDEGSEVEHCYGPGKLRNFQSTQELDRNGRVIDRVVQQVVLQKWNEKSVDNSETSNWITANTKECPKWSVTIEKVGGCNHMVCKNQNCKNEFCWQKEDIETGLIRMRERLEESAQHSQAVQRVPAEMKVEDLQQCASNGLLMDPMRICEQLAASQPSKQGALRDRWTPGPELHYPAQEAEDGLYGDIKDSPLRAKAEEYYWKRFMPTSAAQGAIRMEVSSNNNTNSNTLKLNTRMALAFLENDITTASPTGITMASPTGITTASPTGITTVTLSPPAIERDSEHRPLRRGCPDPHSDDSGISASPQSNKNLQAKQQQPGAALHWTQLPQHDTEAAAAELITRTTFTPQLSGLPQNRNAFRSSHRIRMSWIKTRSCWSQSARGSVDHFAPAAPWLASSVISAKEESPGDPHSDDSGISASPQSNKNLQAKQQQPGAALHWTQLPQHDTEAAAAELITRTTSTPQLSGLPQNLNAFRSSHRIRMSWITPSLASSVISVKEESPGDPHSDDSGISASPQSNKNLQAKQQQKQPPARSSVTLDIGLLDDTEAAAAELITRTTSTPQLSGLPQNRNAFRSSHRIRMSWIKTRASWSQPSQRHVYSAKEESPGDPHSDDSGISASPQSNKNLQAKQQQPGAALHWTQLPQHDAAAELITWTTSTPQLSGLPQNLNAFRNSHRIRMSWIKTSRSSRADHQDDLHSAAKRPAPESECIQEQPQDQDELDQDQGELVTAQPAAVQTTSLLLPIDELSNTPSLASSVISAKEESPGDPHSDDSGISASPQSNKNLQAKQQQKQPPARSSVILDIGLLDDTGAAAAEAHHQDYSMPQLSGLIKRFIAASHGELVTPNIPLPDSRGAGRCDEAIQLRTDEEAYADDDDDEDSEVEHCIVSGYGECTQKQLQDRDKLDHVRGVLVTARPATVQSTSLLLPIDELSNTPWLASSVNSAKEESLDGQHSDDSGISASSQSNKNLQAKQQQQPGIALHWTQLPQHDTEAAAAELITRTTSTPQLSGLPQNRNAFRSSHRIRMSWITPSLASSVISAKEESPGDPHSDDSGISAPRRATRTSRPSSSSQEQRYIGPNCLNMTPKPQQ